MSDADLTLALDDFERDFRYLEAIILQAHKVTSK